MSLEVQGFDSGQIQTNIDMLAENPYPGRGIILGNSADATKSVQAYWVMGRSDNSRNRVLAQSNSTVKTEAFDPSKMKDPSLVIYNAMVEATISLPTADIDNPIHTHLHIISNGDQTDTVRTQVSTMHKSEGWEESFRNALMKREFEPDDPNFTPRITGMLVIRAAVSFNPSYYYSIISRNPTTGKPEYTFGEGILEKDIPSGAGICFHTYKGDGDPLPSFEGSPYGVPLLEATTQETAESLWDNLNSDNRVALAVKTIDKQTGEVTINIINQLTA